MSTASVRTEALGKNLYIYIGGAHVFTSDSLLLADFSAPKARERCCDLGTGCGILPLVWYRDKNPAEIAAVELSQSAVRLFRRTLSENALTDRIQLWEADLRNPAQLPQKAHFDLVTMNPPYKKLGTGLRNPAPDAEGARHETTCTLEDACRAAALLLKFGGRFCLCQRPERLTDVLCVLRLSGLEPKRLRTVIPSPGKPPSLILAEGKKGAAPGLRLLPPLTLTNADGSASTEADRIFRAYEHR